jgi:phosphatidylcholine synthase
VRRIVLAWAVHAYTALGLVLAAGAAVRIVQGGAVDLRIAFLFLWGAVVVDSTDGWLARRVGVSEVLPSFDGRRLDDIIDFHTYVSLPLLLLWRAGIPGEGLGWLLLFPLIAAAYGFSQAEAKTGDGFFLGFPSLWNVVAFYLYFLDAPPWFGVTVILGFGLLTFLPTPYLHPSRAGPWMPFTLAFGAVWALVVPAITLGVLPHERFWLLGSIAFPAYYMGASWFVAAKRRTTARSISSG